MPFQVTARTILQLGAELISSDAIAFYELIKNAFDAGSPKVEVRVVVRIAPKVCGQLLDQCAQLVKEVAEKRLSEEAVTTGCRKVAEAAMSAVNLDAPDANTLKQSLRDVEEIDRLHSILEEANYIQFTDSGEGMSLEDLESVYLVIGTRSRREQRQKLQKEVASTNGSTQPRRNILGEKGLGRLSVMRLGDGLRVQTTKVDEDHYNVLEIDWGLFSHDSNALLESIEVKPVIGPEKRNTSESGTTIRISKLHGNWSQEKLEEVAREELSKFIDPFSRANRSFIVLWFNKTSVVIPNINKKLFENAHASVHATYEFDENNFPRLAGQIDYRLYNVHKTFVVEGAHITSVSKATIETLRALGPFSVEFHWFNRRILTEIEGIGRVEEVRKLVKQWAGGLMVFRDGFRVYPYGGLGDDWLQIDPDALAAQGYKVNRRQIIGKVDISSIRNPALIDQTNREGLRDSPEKEALIALLRHVLGGEFRTLLNKVERERSTQEPVDLEELENRLEQKEKQLAQSLKALVEKYPAIKEEASTLDAIQDTLSQSRRVIDEAREAAEFHENRRDITVHLAGLGLMVDIVAHELYRSTRHALDTVQTIDKEALPAQAKSLFGTLAAQLRTIQARLKVLDPLGPSGRQRKETFDLRRIVDDVLAAHEAQFEREGIKYNCEWTGQASEWNINAVRGMFVQILENLIHNSVYWLRQEKLFRRDFCPEITVRLDRKASRIQFTDNGPGIPKMRRDEVFSPFVTTKPPGEGKGLGLYISREIANYHGASLFLSEEPAIHADALNTFILDLAEMEKSR